ncbi:MAG: Gfo/Idh/MocA family oxidoreductase [Kiritimatiellaeota bacterium]|nr:Gfo/Idh/MocA family oxidoreductase [Kiritimatiellota bacterium]
MQTSRRMFLKSMAASAAAAPFLLPSRVWSAPTSPSGKLTMGFIGMGKQMGGLLGGFLGQDTRCVAVCDVDSTRRNAGKKRVDDFYKNTDCAAYNDFREIINRKDIDAVCIATPDHWHAIPMLAALRAGKDVYCEKPLTHNIHEAVEVMKAVEANKRVLQTGSMQRSSKEFRIACELVQNGIIGKIHHVECQFGDPGRPCDLPEEKMEPGLDWETWIGPGPMRGYSSVLSPRGIHNHFPNWRAYKEYGGGMVCDWGAHHIDIAQWGLGMDNSGPVEVIPPSDANAKRGCKLVYANGIYVQHSDGFGVHFFGSNGEVKVNRGKFVLIVDGKTIADFSEKKPKKGEKAPKSETSCAAEVQKAERAYLKDAKIKLYESKNHISDFMACVKSRTKPVTSELVGAHSAICCHLMNQSYYNHAKFTWDPAKFEFTGGTGNPKWLTRDYRSPWSV